MNTFEYSHKKLSGKINRKLLKYPDSGHCLESVVFEILQKTNCAAILGFGFHYLQNNKRHRANKTYVYSFCICLTRETSVYIVQNKTPNSFEVVGK